MPRTLRTSESAGSLFSSSNSAQALQVSLTQKCRQPSVAFSDGRRRQGALKTLGAEGAETRECCAEGGSQQPNQGVVTAQMRAGAEGQHRPAPLRHHQRPEDPIADCEITSVIAVVVRRIIG